MSAPTTQEIVNQLWRINRLITAKVVEARAAVPDIPDHRRGELEVVLDAVEERLDELFD